MQKVLHLKIDILCKLSEKRQINRPKPGTDTSTVELTHWL